MGGTSEFDRAILVPMGNVLEEDRVQYPNNSSINGSHLVGYDSPARDSLFAVLPEIFAPLPPITPPPSNGANGANGSGPFGGDAGNGGNAAPQTVTANGDITALSGSGIALISNGGSGGQWWLERFSGQWWRRRKRRCRRLDLAQRVGFGNLRSFDGHSPVTEER